MWDLVRYCRATLLTDELITMDEYGELAEDHSTVKRLEGYDKLRAENARLKQQLDAERKKCEALREARRK